jgi:subtilisin family serine protease
MSYKTFHVISNKGFDVRLVKDELTADDGSAEIPNRPVQITDTCAQSKRCISCLLTDDEANLLMNDERIKCVEQDNPHTVIVSHATQDGDFRRSNDAARTNWGLLAHSHSEHVYSTTDTLKSGFTHSIDYSLAGEGVDIIIMDEDMIDHPDLQDEKGNTRFIKHNWNDTWNQAYPDNIDQKKYFLEPDKYYRDYESNHGTSCASMAAGKDYGFAKKAHIYFFKAYFDNPPLGVTNWLHLARAFHENKNNNRPTIFSGSFGQVYQPLAFTAISGGGFRDSLDDEIETWTVGTRTQDELTVAYNLRWTDGISGATGMPSQSVFTDTALEELIDAGVHCFFSAGNSGVRSVKPDHAEYDNYVNTTIGQVFYNRPQSPYHVDAFEVGAIDDLSLNDKYRLTEFTNRGSAVDLFVAGSGTRCASTEHSQGQSILDYPQDSNFKTQKFGGTSGACPLLAGIAALHLSSMPHLTPKQLKARLLNDSWAGIDIESGYLGARAFADSVNRVVYNRYNQAVSVSYNNAHQMQGNLAVTKKPIFETQLHIQDRSFGNQKYGIYREADPAQGYDAAYFANDDTSFIYPNSTIDEFYSEIPETDHRKFTLRFKGAEVYNGNWEKIHIDVSGGREYQSVDLFRKDAIYNDASKTFVWTIESNVDIKTNSAEASVAFGIQQKRRSTLYII